MALKNEVESSACIRGKVPGQREGHVNLRTEMSVVCLGKEATFASAEG